MKKLLYLLPVMLLSCLCLCVASCGDDDDESDPSSGKDTKIVDNAPEGVEAVDLGLPSGTLWANMNIGATTPGDYGDYFAWGETSGYNSGKTTFSQDTYKYYGSSYLKYNTTDRKVQLDAADDAACVNWGTAWRMPTQEQIKELYTCSDITQSWCTQDGVYGRLFKSKINGNSIFLPAAGYHFWSTGYDKDVLSGTGDKGYYWTRTTSSYIYGYQPYYAYCFYFTYSYSESTTRGEDREYGLPVRPVRYQKSTDVGPETYTAPEEAVAVDLGLPSGTKWANINVGAGSPEGYGYYYAWGCTIKQGDYSWKNYGWCEGTSSTLTKYCTDKSRGTVDNKSELKPEDDPAYVYWGSDWRTPSKEQVSELLKNCDQVWTTQNKQTGVLITSKINGNSIFLSSAGYYCGTTNYTHHECHYWTRTLCSDSSHAYEYCYESDTNDKGIDSEPRCYGLNIRAVTNK